MPCSARQGRLSEAVAGLIKRVLKREGGYVNHPADRGGPTNFGITQKTLSAWLGRPATIQEVKSLTVATAIEIYAQLYYSKPRINKLPTQIQEFIFDSSVNHGPKRAVRFVQKICNLCRFGPLVVDGIVGPKTIRAAFAAQEEMGVWFLAALLEERRQFSQEVFRAGWLNRVDEFDTFDWENA